MGAGTPAKTKNRFTLRVNFFRAKVRLLPYLAKPVNNAMTMLAKPVNNIPQHFLRKRGQSNGTND